MKLEFIRFEGQCDYCKTKTKKKYCCEICKNKAGTLRAGVMNKDKMPKKENVKDQDYIQDYGLWVWGVEDKIY